MLDKFLAKGQKGVEGIEGYYQASLGRNDGEVYIPVKVKGVELDGCDPQFKLTVVGGVGDKLLYVDGHHGLVDNRR